MNLNIRAALSLVCPQLPEVQSAAAFFPEPANQTKYRGLISDRFFILEFWEDHIQTSWRAAVLNCFPIYRSYWNGECGDKNMIR
jgi:hypothetical protein